MSTRSLIAIKNSDNIRYIYCHCDGYLAHNGRILLQSYNTPEIINKLIDGGSLSILGKNISTDKPHSFKNPVDGVCVYYGRDRKETNVAPRTCDTEEELLAEGKDRWADYVYLYDGVWKCNHLRFDLVEFTPDDCK
jgi:hypothetical protein